MVAFIDQHRACGSPKPDRQPRRLILRSIGRQDSPCWPRLSFCFERSGCSVVDTEPSRSRTWRCVSSCQSSGARSGVRTSARATACFGSCSPRRGRIGERPWSSCSPSGPPEHPCGHSDTRRPDDRGESSVGSPSHPRGIWVSWASPCRSGPCPDSWDDAGVHRRKRGAPSSPITWRPRCRWTSSPCRHSLAARCSCSCYSLTTAAESFTWRSPTLKAADIVRARLGPRCLEVSLDPCNDLGFVAETSTVSPGSRARS